MTKMEKNYKMIKEVFREDLVGAANLLLEGADVNFVDRDGDTALHLAIRNQNHEMVAMLIEHGADVNAEDSNGYTPLHHAAEMGNNPTVEFLIENGAELDSKNKKGQTPKELAVQYKLNGWGRVVKTIDSFIAKKEKPEEKERINIRVSLDGERLEIDWRIGEPD